jgi:hypothetical protein
MGSCGDGGHFGSGGVRGAEDEVAVGVGGRQCAVGEFLGLDVAGGMGIAGGRWRIFGLCPLRCGGCCRGLCQDGHGERREKDQAEGAESHGHIVHHEDRGGCGSRFPALNATPSVAACQSMRIVPPYLRALQALTKIVTGTL